MDDLTFRKETEEWVCKFHIFHTGMIEDLIKAYPDDWEEITSPVCGDYVCVNTGNYIDNSAEIIDIYRGNSGELYKILLEDIKINTLILERNEFELERNTMLPKNEVMFQFAEDEDDWWHLHENGIRIMSDLGFRIYKSIKWGYFFGLDKNGWEVFLYHWIPLYTQRNSIRVKKDCLLKPNPDPFFFPDTTISLVELKDYGYLWEDILPLRKESAEKWFQENLPIYCLYEDDSECLVNNLEEIESHAENGGLFGIEKGDWETYLKNYHVVLSEKTRRETNSLRRRLV